MTNHPNRRGHREDNVENAGCSAVRDAPVCVTGFSFVRVYEGMAEFTHPAGTHLWLPGTSEELSRFEHGVIYDLHGSIRDMKAKEPPVQWWFDAGKNLPGYEQALSAMQQKLSAAECQLADAVQLMSELGKQLMQVRVAAGKVGQ